MHTRKCHRWLLFDDSWRMPQTNLIGEKAFGDLDFSLFKRRHASLHHHLTVHILKWNRSISAWLDLKDPSEQKRLLDLSAKKAPGLRRKHVMEEKDAVARRQIILEEDHQKKLQTVARRRNKIEQVMTRLRYHKGPCLLPEDLDMMLERYPLAKDCLLAVKAELSYHKLVLLVESPLLRVTGRLPELIRNLKVFLGADPAAVTVPAAPSRKHSRLSSTPDSSDEADQEESHDDDGPSDEEHHDDESLDEESLYQGAVVPEPFEFTRLGEIIAVHYDLEEEFFIGEVEKIISPMEGRVNFLERLAIKKKMYFIGPQKFCGCG